MTNTNRELHCRDALSLNIVMLKLCGLMPIDTLPVICSHILIVCTVFSFAGSAAPAVYGCLCYWNEIQLDDLIHIVTLTEGLIVNGLKLVVLIPKRQRIVESIRLCEKLWDVVESEEEFRIMASSVKFWKRVTYVFSFNCMMLTINLQINAIVTPPMYDNNGTMIKNKPLTYPTEIVNRNPDSYYLFYGAQIPMSLLLSFSVIAVDTIMITLIVHAVAYMKLVNFRLEKLARSSSYRRTSHTTPVDDESRRKLIDCVQHHQKVLSFSQQLEDTFRIVLLLQVTVDTIAIAILSTNFLRKNSPKAELGIHLVSVLAELLLCCLPGELLTSQSIVVADAAYSLQWPSWPVCDQRLVRVMVMRAQKPVIITAGRICSMSLSTFSEIVSKGMSFFTVLRATT